MRVIMESIFDILYLLTVILVGLYLTIKAKQHHDKESLLFGVMALILGLGDAFHLVPRIITLFQVSDSVTLAEAAAANAVALGLGKAITSVTMTVFYVVLYFVWKRRYQVGKQIALDITIYSLAVIRIVLGLLPQNNWLSPDWTAESYLWSLIRNIPFALMGIVIIVLFAWKAKEAHDRSFRFMWLAIVLSFGFYAPVVLWGHLSETIGLLMIPKTMAYVWVVFMGLSDYLYKSKKALESVA
jgi:hypothetical protein